MLLNVDVQAGNQTAPEYAHAGLWGWLDSRPREQWPAMLRGDIAWGTEKTMCGCEARRLPFLFKLRKSEGGSEASGGDFAPAGMAVCRRPMAGRDERVAVAGWTRKRRIVMLRRPLPEESVGAESETPAGQKVLTGMVVLPKNRRLFEYAVLVTSLPEEEVLTIAQQYRDWGDFENIFDELKNQWTWTGFTTHDMQRSQLMARIVALVFNWWNLWVRLAVPGRHTEAITSRPALVYGVAKRTTHANQSKVTITRCHGKAEVIEKLLANVNRFLLRFTAVAEQLNRKQRWATLIRVILHELYPQKPQSPAPLLC